jgi:hypothetical protein
MKTIDWFLPWSKEALASTSEMYFESILEVTKEFKDILSKISV